MAELAMLKGFSKTSCFGYERYQKSVIIVNSRIFGYAMVTTVHAALIAQSVNEVKTEG